MEQSVERLPFTLQDLGNTYVESDERFVVSLVVSYDPRDGITSPEDAVAAALALTRDIDSGGTQWYVKDRKNNILHLIEQRSVE